MRHGRRNRVLAAGLVICLLLLCGCTSKAKKQAQELLGSIDQRDDSLYVNISMASDVTNDDGAHYSAKAEWEDAGGVRHLMSCQSDIMGKSTTAEAWSDKNSGMTYIYTEETGWFSRGYADKADAVPALDLDAALSYISRMARTDGGKDAEANGNIVTWETGFSDVKKLAGDYGSDIKADKANVTAEFNSAGALTRLAVTAEGDDAGRFSVEISLSAWNLSREVLSVPDSVIKECTKEEIDPEFTVDMPEQNPMATYANSVIIPGEFEDEILTMFADTITSSGKDFDKVEALPIPGGNELQYHTHGMIGMGYWFGVVAIDGYGPGGATSRLEELAAYNDAWYGGRIINPVETPDGWTSLASWASMHPDEQAYKLELCFLYGDICVDTQIEMYMVDDMGIDDLMEQAIYMLRTAGLYK